MFFAAQQRNGVEKPVCSYLVVDLPNNFNYYYHEFCVVVTAALLILSADPYLLSFVGLSCRHLFTDESSLATSV